MGPFTRGFFTAMTERKCILLCLKCIMNNIIITPCIMNIIIITSCIQKMRAVADSSFLSFDHLDCLASHSLESEDLDRFSRFLFKFNKKTCILLQVFFKGYKYKNHDKKVSKKLFYIKIPDSP